MSDAAWKLERIECVWAKDSEGSARGFSWCSMCGSHCDVGVVVIAVPREPRGSTLFCEACVKKMAAALPQRFS